MAPESGGKALGSEEVEGRTQWLSEYVRNRLSNHRDYTLIPIQNISGEYAKLKYSTGVIHRCDSCVVDFGKAVGAKYVLVGWVQRFSNLSIKFHLEIMDIGTAKVVDRSSIDMRCCRGSRVAVYDLAVEIFNGMPSWYLLGDPRYQFWLTHTPRGTAVDDPVKVGPKQNAKIAYTGNAFSMYTHTGTRIDR